MLKKTYPLFFLTVLMFGSFFASAQTVGLQIQGNLHIAASGAMHIAYADTYLDNARISTDRSSDYGYISLAPTSNIHHADHNTYVDGVIRMHGLGEDHYTTGHDAVFQPAKVENLFNPNPVDLSFAYLPHAETEREEAIGAVSDRFYWTIHHGIAEAKISLSWNVFSDLGTLVEDRLEDLTIVGFDGSHWSVIESQIDATHFYDGSNSSLLHGSVSSVHPVNLGGYSALSLGGLVSDLAINVSQGFTPNGDGINDTWFLENIQRHPDAVIKVFNRWQQIVFSHTGSYQNDWDGHYQGGPLPAASYFYTIDRDGDGFVDQSGWVYITQ